MSYTSQSSRYLENDVLTRSPEWLVTLIYETLLTNLRRAGVQIENGDYEGKAESLGRAGALVNELIATLDREKGGEIADRLSALYAYFALEIMNVGRSLDGGSLGRLIVMIEELHDAWVQAAEQLAPRSRPANVHRSLSATAA